MSLIPPGFPRAPPAIPTPPAEVVSLLTSNNAPEASDIPIVQGYISDLLHHFSLWKITHIDSLPIASAEFIQEHDTETRSLLELSRSGSLIVMKPPGHWAIDKMPPAVAQLIRERDRLEEGIREHKGILSPIRRLPAELIMKILRLVPPRTFGPFNELEYPPWRLARISSHWRACAVNDSSLWTKISIHGDVYPRKFEEVFPLRMLEVQLGLSRDALLDIHFDWCYFDSSDPHFLALLNSAVDHCGQWDRLVLEGDVNIPGYLSALSRIRLQIPRLRRLEAYLNIWWFNPLGPGGVHVDCFAVAPSLREVFLAKPGFRSSTTPTQPSFVPSIPWAQITKYRAVLPADEHLRILRNANGLRECGILFPGVLDSIQGEHVHLRAVHRLHVNDSTFLDILIAPAVAELMVNRNLDPVLPFLRRSSARLTSLSIFHWEPSPDLVPLLRSCPALTHLCLDVAQNLQNADTVISVLHALGDMDLCPELTSLFWRDETGPNATPDAFKHYEEALHDMIASRRGGKLISFRVFLQSAFPFEPRVQRFRGPQYEGFDVRVSDEYEKPSFLDAISPP